MISSKLFSEISPFENRALQSATVFFGLQLIAFWSVWRWIFIRFQTSAEESWSVFALIAAAFFAFVRQNKAAEKIANSTYFLSAFFILLYAVGFVFDVPLLLRGMLAIISLNLFLSGWRFGKNFHFGLFVLLSMTLPVIASLNFFLGFPMRVIVGEAVEILLKMQGLDVFREGTALRFGEQLIWIDAPCSGIKMLWFGFFLTAILICFFRLKNVQSLIALILAFITILLGNIFRASALFYTESELIKAPKWFHETVGVLVFAFVSLAIVFIVKRIAEFKWQK